MQNVTSAVRCRPSCNAPVGERPASIVAQAASAQAASRKETLDKTSEPGENVEIEDGVDSTHRAARRSRPSRGDA
jgi:hypothetical protein